MMIFHQMEHEYTDWSMSYYHLNATFTTHEWRQSVLFFNVERLEDKVVNDFLAAGVLQCWAGLWPLYLAWHTFFNWVTTVSALVGVSLKLFQHRICWFYLRFQGLFVIEMLLLYYVCWSLHWNMLSFMAALLLEKCWKIMIENDQF